MFTGSKTASLWNIAAVAAAAAMLTGCAQYERLRARKHFKDANAAYTAGDFKKAAGMYEETLKANPEETAAYFFLGNSYDNLYKPARKGEAENDAYLQKAIENYKLSVEREKTNPTLRQRALQFLVNAYGPDKLNDPSQAEPLVQKMIEIDPSETENYFALANIYEQAGNYEQAEQVLLKAKDARPNDSAVYMQLAGFYNRQGEFDKTIEALEQRASREPTNPEAHYTIASFYWDKAYRDFRLKDAEKKDYVQKGVVAVDSALKLNPNYLDAVVYKGLLLRLQANLEKDVSVQQRLMKEAEALQARAKELQKKKAAGVGE